jgi:Holliday junction resolvasome RuvABC endonuclease subunit
MSGRGGVIELAVDPAMRNVGYAIFDNGEVCGYGVVKNVGIKSNDGFRCSVENTAKTLSSLVVKHGVDTIITEACTGAKSYAAARSLFAALSCVISVAMAHSIPISYVPPSFVKAAAGACHTKDDIMQLVRAIYPTEVFPKTKNTFEHIADAIMVYRAWHRL